MRLWGRVAQGLSLVIAAVLAVVAILTLESRPQSVLAVVFMVAPACSESPRSSGSSAP